MTPYDFTTAWRHNYPGYQPISHRMRTAGARHWLRFHSLPGSKRFAETVDEWSVLFARHNAIAGDVLGSGPCWLVQAQWITPEGASEEDADVDPFLGIRDFRLTDQFQFQDPEDKNLQWKAFANRTSWAPGRFDGLLRHIADDRSAPTLWMADTGSIFAPYEGGVDLFLPNASEVGELRRRYADWLSRHPSGL